MSVDISTLLALRCQGLSGREIGRKLGLTRHAVIGRLWRHGRQEGWRERAAAGGLRMLERRGNPAAQEELPPRLLSGREIDALVWSGVARRRVRLGLGAPWWPEAEQ